MDGHGEIESSPTHLLTPAGTGLKRDEQLYQTEGWEPGQPLSQAPWDPFQVAASRLGLPAGREVGTSFQAKGQGSSGLSPHRPASGSRCCWSSSLGSRSGGGLAFLRMCTGHHCRVLRQLSSVLWGWVGSPMADPSSHRPHVFRLGSQVSGVGGVVSPSSDAFVGLSLPCPASFLIRAGPSRGAPLPTQSRAVWPPAPAGPSCPLRTSALLVSSAKTPMICIISCPWKGLRGCWGKERRRAPKVNSYKTYV